MNMQASGSIKFQKGAVLIASLVFMVLLTALAVGTIRSNVVDMDIGKSMMNRNIASECAESGLRAAELWIENELTDIPDRVLVPPDSALNQVWSHTAAITNSIGTQSREWWVTNGWVGTGDMIDDDHLTGCQEKPRYLIEHLGVVDDGSGDLEISEVTRGGTDYFRITAYGIGAGGETTSVLQTTYAKRLR